MSSESPKSKPEAKKSGSVAGERETPSSAPSPTEQTGDRKSLLSEFEASFEQRLGSLQTHIGELESRLEELHTSRDRASGMLNDFLNHQDLVEIIRGTPDPLKVIEALHRVLRKFVVYDHLGIFLLDESGSGVEPMGPAPAELIRAAQSQFEEGIFDWVISEHRPVILPWMESLGEEREQNLIIIPLIARDQPLGMALLTTVRRIEDFSSHDLRLLYFIVSHAAIGIQNALLLHDLKATQDFLLTLLENSGDFIFALDMKGHFNYVNPRIEELGFRKEELAGQSFQKLFRQVDIGERVLNLLTRGGKLTADLELRSHVARHQQHHLSLNVLKNERGERIGALGTLRNVTEANRQQRKQLESERLAAYTQTVITLNHEINNPLTAVLGNLYLLEKEARNTGDKKILERLKIIQENCLRIQKVIKKLERIEELKTVSYLGETKMVDIGEVHE